MSKRHIPIIEKLGIGEEASGLTSFVETSAGEIQVKTPSGVQEIAHEGNINTILQAAGGAGWQKVQATTASYTITRPASGAGLDLHIESGGSLANLTSTSWPIPANGVDQLRIRNFSGAAKTLTAGTGWTIVTADGNPVTGDSYSIPDDRAIEVTLDPDGFAQVVPWGGEVSEATFNTGMALKANTTSLTDGSIQALLDTLRADSVHFLASATSVDTLTTTGWYNIQNATGGPAGGGWYYYFHGTHRNTATGAPDTNYGFQFAKRLDAAGTNNLLMRIKTANSWSAWTTLATTDAATTTVAGLMSATDKTKLDGVATSAAAVASTGTPAMDGTAAIGTGTTSARADHIYPSDTSRASLVGATFTGDIAVSRTVTGTANMLKLENNSYTANDKVQTIFEHGTTQNAQAIIQTNLPGSNDVDLEFYTTNNLVLNSTPALKLTGNNTIELANALPVVQGGTGSTTAGAALTALGAAPLASPTLTGTIQLDGSPILGDGANHGQRSFSDVTGASMLMTNTTGTGTSTIATTDIAARFVKPGTASAKQNASMDIVIGSHTAGINANTQVDFRLGNGATNTPDVTVLSLKGDGSVLAGANQLATTAVATTSANGLMASADKTKLDGVATGAEVNVQADWTQATSTDDSFVKNKPTIPALEGTTTPVMNGTAAAGTATTSSRSDHVHGSDTAKANTTALTDGSVSAQFDELRFDNVRAISNTDLNTLNVSGFYDGTNLTNAPGASTGWFYIEHLRHSNFADPNWRMQKAYGLGSPNSGFSAVGTMYIRTMASGTWSAWRTVTTTAT